MRRGVHSVEGRRDFYNEHSVVPPGRRSQRSWIRPETGTEHSAGRAACQRMLEGLQ